MDCLRLAIRDLNWAAIATVPSQQQSTCWTKRHQWDSELNLKKIHTSLQSCLKGTSKFKVIIRIGIEGQLSENSIYFQAYSFQYEFPTIFPISQHDLEGYFESLTWQGFQSNLFSSAGMKKWPDPSSPAYPHRHLVTVWCFTLFSLQDSGHWLKSGVFDLQMEPTRVFKNPDITSGGLPIAQLLFQTVGFCSL